MATAMIRANVLMTLGLIGKFAARLIICMLRMINAGPETKADAIKRGASKAECHNGRAGLAENKNAVTA